MENDQLNYSMNDEEWKKYFIECVEKYTKSLRFKDLDNKSLFKLKEKNKSGLYVFNTSYSHTSKALANRCNFWDRITFAYVLNYNHWTDYEILIFSPYTLTSRTLNKENAKDLEFLREVIQKSGHIDFQHFIHIPLIHQELIKLKEKHTGNIKSFYQKFSKNIEKLVGAGTDVWGITDSASPLGDGKQIDDFSAAKYSMLHMIGKNTKDIIAKNIKMKKSTYNLDKTYIANTNSWKLLEGRNIVYENRFINWNESYNLNN